MSGNIAIKVENVSKTFRLPHEKNNSIKNAFINFYRRRRTFEKQQALKDVSFEVKKGEFFGIVGRNGGGKSTLLKILAGIYSPSKGKVWVNGKLTPFIELGVGFNPELTGRENVYLNGALLGLNRKEMDTMYHKIVEFAELERFMDQKLKNYSSGMQVRLAFSIAIRAQGDILLLDEVLAVGDVKFQQKCFEYFYQLKREKRTIIFVTHDMEAVQKFCDRAIVIHDGYLIFAGRPTEAAIKYKELNFPDELKREQSQNAVDTRLKIKLTDKNQKPKTTFSSREAMLVSLEWKRNTKAQFLGVAIHRDDGMYIFGPNNFGSKRAIAEDQHSAQYMVDLNLGSGSYYVEVAVFGKDESEKIYYTARGPSFVVHNPYTWQGVVELPHRWDVS